MSNRICAFSGIFAMTQSILAQQERRDFHFRGATNRLIASIEENRRETTFAKKVQFLRQLIRQRIVQNHDASGGVQVIVTTGHV